MQGWRKLAFDLRSAGRKVSVTVGAPRRSWRSEVSLRIRYYYLILQCIDGRASAFSTNAYVIGMICSLCGLESRGQLIALDGRIHALALSYLLKYYCLMFEFL